MNAKERKVVEGMVAALKEREAIEILISALQAVLDSDKPIAEETVRAIVYGKEIRIPKSLIFGDWEKTNITALVIE